MDWYQHSTSSHDDPDISDAMDEFGPAGYSVFFITLELYGNEYNHVDNEGWLKLSVGFLRRKLRVSQTKVEQILNFYSERQRIVSRREGNFIYINSPKFVDIASNWTKRKRLGPTESLQSPSVVPTAIEKEEEKEEKKNKKYIFNKPALSDVKAYCVERKNRVNPQAFIDHYESNGWKVGKNAMKDWKAAVRTWEHNNGTGRSNQGSAGKIIAEAGRAKSDGADYPTDHEF